jgi:hypothetical protein
MKITENLFRKFKSLASEVKEDLRSRGIVVPISTKNGVKLGNYTVIKLENGFYSVVDIRGRVVHDKINLPQTALLIANDLALGKWGNISLLEVDKEYGFSDFERTNYRRLSELYVKQGNWDKFEAVDTKWRSAEKRAERSMQIIIQSFEKLRHLR